MERIVHTAAMSHPELSIDFPVATFAANVDGTVHLLEAARLAGVRRVVNFSSHCSYGHIDADPIPEDAPLHPTTPTASRRSRPSYGLGLPPAVRRRGRVAARQRGLRPRQPDAHRPHGHAPRRARRRAATPSPRAATTGSSTSTSRTRRPRASPPPRSSDLGQDVYNITGDRQVTLSEAAGVVRALVPGASIEIGAGLHRRRSTARAARTSPRRARDLGYAPRWTLEDGVRAYADWLRAHPH